MIDTDASTVDVILESCRRFRDRPAFTCLGRSLRYGELDTLSARFAGYLRGEAGLKPGERIAIQMPNLLQYPVAVLGALRAGLVVVNTNPLYSPNELEHQLQDAGASALVLFAHTAESAARVLARTPVRVVILTDVGDLHGALRGTAMNLALRWLKKKVPPKGLREAVSFRRALALGAATLAEAESAAPTDLALLQYTGGTTGVAKGAMLSHANLVANLNQFSERLQDDCPGAGAIMVAPLPLYHIYAFTTHMLYGLQRGLHQLLIPNPRDIPGLVKAMRPHRVEGFVGINSLYNALCASDAFASLDLSSMRISSAGGMALSSRTAERWERLTGCRILEGYGLTEASPLVACNNSAFLRQGTIGRPVSGTEIRIVRDDGSDAGDGEAGELWVRGPQVMAGYWRRPEETRDVLNAEGWLRTGDVARREDGGFLRIVDRIKDMIIVSGYNVFPAEIEEYVCRHPDIREAAAVGVQRGEVGEKVKLFVVSDNPALSRQDIIDYCSRGLAPYKVPRLVEFRDSLPRSNVGKVLRRELREMARV